MSCMSKFSGYMSD